MEDGVYYCGFNSEKSFGANSFFVQHPDGNWLVDSPRYIKQLVEFFERNGGLRYIFLSHEDDVADAGKYAKHFSAKRIIHREDADAVPDAEWIIEGTEAVSLAPEFLAIPVPAIRPAAPPSFIRIGFSSPATISGGTGNQDSGIAAAIGLESLGVTWVDRETLCLSLRMGPGRSWGSNQAAR